MCLFAHPDSRGLLDTIFGILRKRSINATLDFQDFASQTALAVASNTIQSLFCITTTHSVKPSL